MTTFYRPSPFERDWRKIRKKGFETFAKSVILLMYPIPCALFAALVWHNVVYRFGWHFGEQLEKIAQTWIPVAGVFYVLFATLILNWVWQKYNDLRQAIRRCDKECFMALRDEDVSPVFHVLLTALGLILLGAFMGFEYPNALSGMISSAGAAYLLCLVSCIIVQVDGPFSGIWFIKYIPEGWLEEDPKAWRDRHCKQKEGG